MKLRNLLITLGLTLTVGAGVAVAASAKQSEEPKAAEAAGTSGSLIVKFASNHNWFQSGAKICAYITDDSSTYWTALQTSSTTKLLYKFDYNVNFIPTKLIWVRMNPAATSGNWDQKWNQTGDLGWEEATYINNGWDNPSTSQWTLSADVMTSTGGSFSKKTTLSAISLNTYNNPEVSGTVSLSTGERFKIQAGDGNISGYYGRNDIFASCFSDGSTTGETESPITCNFGGSYAFYFDTERKIIWIERSDITADNVKAADAWATSFLTQTDTACGVGQQGDNHLSGLQAFWEGNGSTSSCDMRGSFNNWTGGQYVLSQNDDKYYYPAFNFALNDEFKITNGSDWYPSGDNWKVTAAYVGWHSVLLSNGTVSLEDPYVKEYYSGLDSAVQTIIKTGDGNPNIQDALERYRVIVGRYTALSEFMSIGRSTQSRLLIPFVANNTVVTVTIICALSLTAVGAYFFFKKSKKTEE